MLTNLFAQALQTTQANMTVTGNPFVDLGIVAAVLASLLAAVKVLYSDTKKLQTQILAIHKFHQEQIQEIQSVHRKDVQELQSAHRQEIQNILQQQQERVDQLAASFQEKLDKVMLNLSNSSEKMSNVMWELVTIVRGMRPDEQISRKIRNQKEQTQ